MRTILTVLALLMISSVASGQSKDVKTKFYNFDDLLINGEYKKPQVMYIDTDSKIRFERLLKLKKDFLPRLIETRREPALR